MRVLGAASSECVAMIFPLRRTIQVNAIWVPAFFGLHNPPLALAVMLMLLTLIALTMHSFARLNRAAVWLMLPYLLWTGFATYLDAGFWWLNSA